MFVVQVGSRRHHGPLLGEPAAARRQRLRLGRSPSGSGSRCCSPTSPRRSPRAGARPRPTRLRKTSAETVAHAAERNWHASQPRCPRTQLQLGRPRASSRPARSSPATATSSRASPRWTSRPSPASRRRSSASRAATAPRSPAAPRCCPTGSWCEITTKPGESFIDRMIALVEGASRQKTPNEIALNILLAGLTIIFLLAVVTLQPFAQLRQRAAVDHVLVALLVVPDPDHHRRPAVGHRHRRHGPPRAAQRAGHVRPGGRGGRRRLHPAARQDRHHHLRQPHGRRVPPGRRRHARSSPRRALLSSLADETPEGRSIVALAEELRPASPTPACRRSRLVPFTAQTRMSGIDSGGPCTIRKGAADSVAAGSRDKAAPCRPTLAAVVDGIATAGGTPLVVAEGQPASASLGVIHLKDTVKAGHARALRRDAPAWASRRS